MVHDGVSIDDLQRDCPLVDPSTPVSRTARRDTARRDTSTADEIGALQNLYETRRERLAGLAHWIVGDRALAEELVQDTFARLVERPPELTDPDALEAYARTAVVNRSRSRVRRLVLERRHRNQAGYRCERIDPSEPVDTAVRDAIATLPRRQRECVVLRFYADLSVDGIATTLGIGSGSVKTHLHRGLTRLEQLLALTETVAEERGEGRP